MAALVARCLHSSNCIRNSTKSILLGTMIYIYRTFDVTGLLGYSIIYYNCTPLLMTNVKVSPQDIKPLHHTPPRTFILDPLWTHFPVHYH